MDCPESFVHMLHWAKQHSVFSLFAHLTIQSDTINAIKHKGKKRMILIFVLYQHILNSRTKPAELYF